MEAEALRTHHLCAHAPRTLRLKVALPALAERCMIILDERECVHNWASAVCSWCRVKGGMPSCTTQAGYREVYQLHHRQTVLMFATGMPLPRWASRKSREIVIHARHADRFPSLLARR